MSKQAQELLEADVLHEANRMAQVFYINELMHKLNQMYLTYQIHCNEEGGEDFASEMIYLNELLFAISKLNR